MHLRYAALAFWEPDEVLLDIFFSFNCIILQNLIIQISVFNDNLCFIYIFDTTQILLASLQFL